MELRGRYGYNTEELSSAQPEDIEALRIDLQTQIDTLSGGGDPEVIGILQAAVDALETSQAAQDTLIASKASGAGTTAALALKADAATVDASLALKAAQSALDTTNANLSALTTTVSGKASTSALTSGLALKANQTDLDAAVTSIATKADGTATTTALGTKANTSYVDTVAGDLVTGLAAKLNKVADQANINPQQLQVKVVRVGDATATSGWKNTYEIWYTPNGGTSRLVMWFNEFGELRGLPGNPNTVAARWFTRDLASDTVHTGNMIEVADHREDPRTVLFAVDSAGGVYAASGQFVGNVTVGGTLVVTGRITAPNHMNYMGPYASAPSTTGWPSEAFWWLTTGETDL